MTKLILVVILLTTLSFVNLLNVVVNSLSVTNINPNQGSITGGTEVVIVGDFNGSIDQVMQVSAGVEHTCALDFGGKAYCWGNSTGGALGNGTAAFKYRPAAVDDTGVLAGKKLKQISAGSNNTCAIDTDGKAYCWGSNTYGQLGNGVNGSATNSSVPVEVDMTGVLFGKELKQITVGNPATCVLDTQGKAYCWGRAGYQQSGSLGNGQYQGSSVPVEVDMTGVLAGKELTQITNNGLIAYVIDTDGKIYYWGGSDYGTPKELEDPLGVLDGKVLKQVESGYSHACALDTDGKAYCWGYGMSGAIGVPESVTNNMPITAVDTTGVLDGKELVQLAAAGSTLTATHYTCGIDTDKQIYCWGHNREGQLGISTNVGPNSCMYSCSFTPVKVDMTGALNDRYAKSISAMSAHTCVIDNYNKLFCWGAAGNTSGKLGDGTTTDRYEPVCVHTIRDSAASELPGTACGDELLTVTMDAGGTPAECLDVVVATDGQSLTCTTTAHVAGMVDVTIDDGVSTVTLTGGYEYIAPETTTDSVSHILKLNVYDSTSITTMIETCDSIKAEQAAKGTYEEETYNELMRACNEAEQTLECLEQGGDITECGDPDEEKEIIEDLVKELKPKAKPGTKTNPVGPDGKVMPPNTDANTWNVAILGRNYAIPTFPFIMLSIATLSGIALTIYLIRRHIKKQGIDGVKVTQPWSKDSYKVIYQKNLVKKHENDPLTEILDVSQIVKKYRIKYVLWHTVPVFAILVAFFTLILTTAPTMADSEYAEISLTTAGGATTTIINIDKASSGNANSYGTSIQAINTDVHSGGMIDEDSGVFAKYDAPSTITSNVALTAEQTTPNNNPLPNVILSDEDELIVPPEFDTTTLEGQHTFGHTMTLDLDNILTIANGSYSIELTYTIIANEPYPEPSEPPTPPTTPVEPLTAGCGALGDFKGHVGSMQTFVDTWDIYDYGVATDSRNNQDYYICKLPDEHVWMLNNLKIGLSEISDASPTLSNPGVNMTAMATQTAPSTLGMSYDEPRYYDPTGSTNDITEDTFYGYLYNWCASTGGTSGTCTASTVDPAFPTTDMCPANWRLPTGDLNGEFAWLNAKMANPSATVPSTANYYQNWQFTGLFRGVFSGAWGGTSFYGQGIYAFVMSSSRMSDSYGTFGLHFISTNIVTSNEGGRQNTRAIRCLLGTY